MKLHAVSGVEEKFPVRHRDRIAVNLLTDI